MMTGVAGTVPLSDRVFHAGAAGYGWLNGGWAVGAFLSAAYSPMLMAKVGSRMAIAISMLLLTIGMAYKIKEASLANAAKENASSYGFSILFSAINAGNEVDPRIQNFIMSKADTSSKVFLFSVYGDIYNKKGKHVDATTEATKALHPELIADQILRTIKPSALHPRQPPAIR